MTLPVRFAAFLLFSLIAATALAQYQPQVGQAGKDVIWVPTPDEVVDRMLTMAQVTPQDFVMDLGAGDGKIAIAAAKKFGARAVGIEYNPEMAKHANANAAAAGVAGNGPGKATIRQADIFQTDIKDATVITLYLLPALNMKLRPTILAMRPGTRVVSHSFTMRTGRPTRSRRSTAAAPISGWCPRR
jgi:tRNA G37 N-methylase Trm5